MRKNALSFFCPFCSETTFGFGAVFTTLDFLAGALPQLLPSLFPDTAFGLMLPDAESDPGTNGFPPDVTEMFS